MNERTDEPRWVGTWATAPVPTEGVSLDDQTVRSICRISLGGPRVRVRFSNTFGRADLEIAAAHVAVRADGATTVPGTDRPLAFGGAPTITVPAGASVLSDPVDLQVEPLSDLAVSLHLPGKLTDAFGLTGHDPAHQTNYVSERGDFTATQNFPVAQENEVFLFVTGVEVMAPAATGGIVALGDSLTEGNLSTLDANARWPDQLARRLVARTDGRQFGVMNLGTGGGRLLHDGHGDSGLRRFERDVLGQSGATHLVVLLGINDLRNSHDDPAEVVDAARLIAGLHQVAVRARTAGLTAYVGTVMPWEEETFNGGHYSPAAEAERQELNAWIRRSDCFDGVIDFDAALRDPDHPTRLLPRWDCGDHLHPDDDGYRHMGDSIDLTLFD